MKFELAQYSRQGARATNEDRVAVAERHNAVILAVADGLGGHSGGALAAEMFTETVTRTFLNVKQREIVSPSAFLALTILQAHKLIIEQGKAHVPKIEPRTTCVLCLVQHGFAYWAHVGDSRLYHFREGKLLQRTQDHSAIEQLRSDGVITEEEMVNHPSKGRLLKCVGGPNKPVISLSQETLLRKGDALLLCTDGVWQAFTPKELLKYLKYSSLEEGTEEMLVAAEAKMGDVCDNVSAISFRWQDHATRAVPLQGSTVLQIDEAVLLKNAATAAAKKPRVRAKQAGKPKNRGQRRQSIDTDIRELEEYIKRFEPKS
jgi:PPM family protein phosphatase